MKIVDNCSLLERNTFGIDAKCRRLIEYSSTDDARQVAPLIREEPVLILGGGSNLLLTRDYPSTVVTTEKRMEVDSFRLADDESGVYLRCWAGTTFDDVVAYAVENGLYGAENLSLIPGEVGASAVQNIGAYGAEAQDIIYQVEAVEISTGKVVTMTRHDCQYAYRWSRFKGEWHGKYLISWVTYRLSLKFEPNLKYAGLRKQLESEGYAVGKDTAGRKLTAAVIRDTVISIRRAKLPDPKVEGNAGSFFMNPIVSEDKVKSLLRDYPDLRYFPMESAGEYKLAAGWLIDQCGWKGKSLGAAGVHDKQALVLVNRGGATGEDIVRLMHAIQTSVKDKFGVELHPEVNVI